MNPQDKVVIKWLHIILENKINDTMELQKRIGDLNHQIQHFESMRPEIKRMVVLDLIEDVNWYNKHSSLDWSNCLNTLKDISEGGFDNE